MSVETVDGVRRVVGHQFITSLSSAVALTVPSGATSALIQAETKDIRWRADGTAPTTTVGMLLEAGKDVYLPILILSDTKLIETEASATANVLYLA